MFKDLLTKLRSKKNKLEEYQVPIKDEVIQEEKTKKEILITEENGFYKVVIDEYLSLREYKEIEDNSDKKYILDLIGPSIVFNRNFTATNKGTIYVKEIDNKIYNILFTNNEITIREHSKDNMDDDEKSIILHNIPSRTENTIGDYVTRDRTITLNINRNTYNYSHVRHLYDGDTYYVKVYDKNYNAEVCGLFLDDTIVYEEIETILNNLDDIEEINTILDINLFRENILNYIKGKTK